MHPKGPKRHYSQRDPTCPRDLRFCTRSWKVQTIHGTNFQNSNTNTVRDVAPCALVQPATWAGGTHLHVTYCREILMRFPAEEFAEEHPSCTARRLPSARPKVTPSTPICFCATSVQYQACVSAQLSPSTRHLQSVAWPSQVKTEQGCRLRMRGTQVRAVQLVASENLHSVHALV